MVIMDVTRETGRSPQSWTRGESADDEPLFSLRRELHRSPMPPLSSANNARSWQAVKAACVHILHSISMKPTELRII